MNEWYALSKFSWSHYLRHHYRHSGDAMDPVIGFIIALLMFLFVPLCFYLAFDYYDIEDGVETTMETIAACTTMVSPAVIALSLCFYFLG